MVIVTGVNGRVRDLDMSAAVVVFTGVVCGDVDDGGPSLTAEDVYLNPCGRSELIIAGTGSRSVRASSYTREFLSSRARVSRSAVDTGYLSRGNKDRR